MPFIALFRCVNISFKSFEMPWKCLNYTLCESCCHPHLSDHLHWLCVRHRVPDLPEIQGHLWREPRHIQSGVPGRAGRWAGFPGQPRLLPPGGEKHCQQTHTLIHPVNTAEILNVHLTSVSCDTSTSVSRESSHALLHNIISKPGFTFTSVCAHMSRFLTHELWFSLQMFDIKKISDVQLGSCCITETNETSQLGKT